ncbi:hypothetical protein ACJJTC_004761 [Scirpophaga incertulas]
MKKVYLLIVCVIGIVICAEIDFKGFDDTILFGINWPGVTENLGNAADEGLDNLRVLNKETLNVITPDKEKYQCLIPEFPTKETSNIEEYDGPSPMNLLKPLFAQKICSYRLDSYWSYEVCHGRYIRQYHDERDGKAVKTQEYYLGNWSPEKQLKRDAEQKEQKPEFKTTTVEGLMLPYVEMIFDDGTICDLNGNARTTRVKYVCYAHGRHELYSFKEVATCEYEIIILSPLLCEHPTYKPREVSENIIDCIPMLGAPKKPQSLLKSEFDILKFQHQSIRFQNNGGETHLKFELHPLNEESEYIEDNTLVVDDAPTVGDVQPPPAPVLDDSPVRAFLNGENCLNGGTGWWKYEFCYGKHVAQYHVGRGGDRTTLRLGTFDEAAHLQWVQENRGKAPKPLGQRTSISHFYSGGDICDKTGKPRQTEVKLKCFENSSTPAQVSMYLLEPRTCHYILGVESPLICDILPLADRNGLIRLPMSNVTKQDGESETDQENEVPMVPD